MRFNHGLTMVDHMVWPRCTPCSTVWFDHGLTMVYHMVWPRCTPWSTMWFDHDGNHGWPYGLTTVNTMVDRVVQPWWEPWSTMWFNHGGTIPQKPWFLTMVAPWFFSIGYCRLTFSTPDKGIILVFFEPHRRYNIPKGISIAPCRCPTIHRRVMQ